MLRIRREHLFLVLMISILMLVSCAQSHDILSETPKNVDAETKETVQVKVLRVIDGDTIVVDFNGTDDRVRFIGVDTPETVHPTKGEEPFGREASEFTKEKLEGKKVGLEFDVQERDQYGRLLAYIWIEDEHFNATLIEEGYATVSTWPPNVKYVDTYTELQKEARESKKGLWGEIENASQYIVGSYEIDPTTGLALEEVNINTATHEELQLIPGIGPSIAERIIAHRKNKEFRNKEDLLEIRGIGEATFIKLKDYIKVR